MSLPPRNHRITLTSAAEYTRRYREAAPGQTKGGAFHADQVRELVEQPGCAALRYYHGLDEAGERNVVLVGVTVDDHDMLEGVLLELRYPCPPYCAQPNVLNGIPRVAGKAPLRTTPVLLPSRDHHITLEEAAAYTRRYRLKVREGERGGAFHADQVRELLGQRECIALRYYYGREESGAQNLVLVGMDREGADMTDGTLLELRYPCPPYCADLNVLNSGRRAAAVTSEVA